MLCTFCGTENRPEHKFCGMCGVRMERRKEQRRGRQASGDVTCQACGHVNDSQTKFCGMCGLRVERRAAERRSSSLPDSRAAAIANAQLPTPDVRGRRSPFSAPSLDVLTPPSADEIEARRAAENIFHSRPSPETTIGGPSFLGLGRDSEPAQSEYLLEDEAPSGGGRVLVFLVMLALVAGLAYMGYRSGYFANLQASTVNKKQPAPSPLPDASPSATPANQDGSTVPGSNVPSSAAPGTNPLADPSTSSLAPLPGESKGDRSATDIPERADPAANTENTPQSDAAQSNASQTNDKLGDQPKAPKEIAPPAKRKPSMALIQAQNYLQGRGGVRQNCEQGLVYLKAATEKSDPAAAVQMGALYASGHCVQQDRVMAYRWFNSAHELDPANPWIQTNLDQLWAQMSPQERHQIAR